MGIEAYKKTDVMTANRETILLMMYAGALRFLKKAIEASEKDDIAEKGKYIRKTQDIVNELRATLNFEVGGDLATSLDSLYAYISDRLLQANLQKKTEFLTEALALLTTLSAAWEEAINTLRKEKSQTATK